MNAKKPLEFQRLSFRQAPQKSNLEAIIESMFLAQQKKDKYIKQLASQVDVLTGHNKMLEAQIVQQASSSSIPHGRLPGKP